MNRLLLLMALLCSGCLNTGRVKNGPVSITPPANASSPSSASVEVGATETVIPAGAVKRITETEASVDSPATRETVYEFPVASVERQSSTKHTAIIANERPPDQAVALAKVAAGERRYLLLIGAGLGIAGVVLMQLMPAWRGVWMGAFAGSALALAAWKLSELPAWVWAVAIGVTVLIATGYKKRDAEKPE